jgi:hypothetical protein
MEKPTAPVAFSPEDLARRKRRSVVMAWILAAMAVMFFVSTLVRLGASILDRSM